jgi:hypothetical protein
VILDEIAEETEGTDEPFTVEHTENSFCFFVFVVAPW